MKVTMKVNLNANSIAAALLIVCAPPALANIDIVFDYSYDSSGYFDAPGTRDVLEQAAAVFESRLEDTLGAISAPGYSISIFDPTNPFGPEIELPNQTFATNEVHVYVGGYTADDGNLGLGGPGGYACTGMTACIQAERGQTNTTGTGATDFAPWGGAISFNFDPGIVWNTSVGAPHPGQDDLYSVTVHELGHLLGFGTATSFFTYVSGSQFQVGSASYTLYGDKAHWATDTMSFANGVAQEAAMTPFIYTGMRKQFTELDYAALDQVGWQVAAVPEADTWAMLLAGLGLLGWMARRR